MSVLKVRKIKKALLSKGFIEDTKSGNTDHHYYRLYNHKGEKTSVTTKISRGETEIDNFLIGKMSKQLKLSKRQFISYVSCKMKKEDYLNRTKKY